MIALCPNYHAIKTRGSTREQMRAALIVVSKERHNALMAGTGHGTS
jgi:5-methylcytosine-specific restriction enzyme A